MMLPLLQSLAEMSVGRILNTVPEGLLIASFVWALLRLLPRLVRRPFPPAPPLT